jgi:hypothetical protein
VAQVQPIKVTLVVVVNKFKVFGQQVAAVAVQVQ